MTRSRNELCSTVARSRIIIYTLSVPGRQPLSSDCECLKRARQVQIFVPCRMKRQQASNADKACAHRHSYAVDFVKERSLWALLRSGMQVPFLHLHKLHPRISHHHIDLSGGENVGESSSWPNHETPPLCCSAWTNKCWRCLANLLVPAVLLIILPHPLVPWELTSARRKYIYGSGCSKRCACFSDGVVCVCVCLPLSSITTRTMKDDYKC